MYSDGALRYARATDTEREFSDPLDKPPPRDGGSRSFQFFFFFFFRFDDRSFREKVILIPIVVS